jgi:hypothetical protein
MGTLGYLPVRTSAMMRAASGVAAFWAAARMVAAVSGRRRMDSTSRARNLVVEGGLGEEAGGTALGEDLGVASLVVLGSVRVGDQEAGHAEVGELSE